MLQQAIDFRDESDALFTLLDSLDDQAWERKTQFKGWTLNDVVAHLHFGDYAADLSLQDSTAFNDFVQRITASRKQGIGHLAFTHTWLEGTKNRALLERWHGFSREMAERFLVADPKQRVQWFGPSMSVRSSITARLMETWAHGQAVYDLLGQIRPQYRPHQEHRGDWHQYLWLDFYQPRPPRPRGYALCPTHSSIRGDLGVEPIESGRPHQGKRGRVLSSRNPSAKHC